MSLELNLPLFDVTVMACRHDRVVVQPTYPCRMTQFVGSFDDQAALAMRGCGFPDYNILVKGTSCKQRGVWGPVYTCGSG